MREMHKIKGSEQSEPQPSATVRAKVGSCQQAELCQHNAFPQLLLRNQGSHHQAFYIKGTQTRKTGERMKATGIKIIL